MTWSALRTLCSDPRHDRSRAGFLLLVFALALLGGVLVHPVEGDQQHTACHEGLDHLDHEHDTHDEAACAFCHLTQDLGQAHLPGDSPDVTLHTPEPLPAPAQSSKPDRSALFSFLSRGPPAV